jgi:hypothetical protein
MAELRQMPLKTAAHRFPPVDQQTPCHWKSASKTPGFCNAGGPVRPAIDAANGRNFRLR